MSLFDGPANRDMGMARAENNANQVHGNWSDQAFQFLAGYDTEGPFMGEDVRQAAEGIVPAPPHKRAWGPIIRRAAMAGLIHKVGTSPVKDPNGHCGLASIWIFNKPKTA